MNIVYRELKDGSRIINYINISGSVLRHDIATRRLA